MEQYKGNFTEREVSKSSGRNRFDTDEEREAYTTWQMYKEDKEASKKEKGKKQSLEERAKLKLAVREMALQGDKRRKKEEEEKEELERFEEEGMERDIFSAGFSPSYPIDLLEEDSRILKESLEHRQNNDAKLVEKTDLLLEATKKNTELLTAINKNNTELLTAIKNIGNALLDLAKK